jgi:hypothetical protein
MLPSLKALGFFGSIRRALSKPFAMFCGRCATPVSAAEPPGDAVGGPPGHASA